MNPYLNKPTGPNPFLATPQAGASNPFLNVPKASTPNPYTPQATQAPTAGMTPFVPNQGGVATSVPIPPVVKNAVASSPVAASAAPATPVYSQSNANGQFSGGDLMPSAGSDAYKNLQATQATGFSLASSDNTYGSNYLNTGTTRQDVYGALGQRQQDLALGTNPSLQPTSGYSKFLSDYSNAVQYTPEQQAAYHGMNQTSSQISDIQRELQDRRAQLTQNGSLSPAQVEADMKQYTTDANQRIADLQSQNRDYTLTFNTLDQARKNTLDAYQIQSPFYQPKEIAPGSQLIDPSTGQPITQGTGVSPSTAASYASQLFNDDIKTGSQHLTPDGQIDTQYYYQRAQQILGGQSGGGSSMGSTPATPGTTGQSGLPATLQPYVTQGTGGNYINEDKVPAAQKDFIKQQAAQNGIAYLTGDDISKYRNIEVTQSNLDSLQQVVQKVNGAGLAGRTFGAVWNVAQSVLQTNKDISSYNVWRDTAINTIQALAGGSGSGLRLNQAEIDTATGNLPKITDNLETATTKLNLVRGFLGKWQSELLHGNVNGPQGKPGSSQSTGQAVTNSKGQVISASF